MQPNQVDPAVPSNTDGSHWVGNRWDTALVSGLLRCQHNEKDICLVVGSTLDPQADFSREPRIFFVWILVVSGAAEVPQDLIETVLY